MTSSREAGYLIPVRNPRPLPEKISSPKTFCKSRFKENTNLFTVNLAFVLPALASINQEMDKRIRAAEDISLEELKEIVVSSGRKSFAAYSDRLLNVACQTGIAYCLSKSTNPIVMSIVYQWDITPIMNRFYYDKLCHRLCLPRFLSISGTVMAEAERKFLTAEVSSSAVLEDAIKRKLITLGGGSIAMVVREIYSKLILKKKFHDDTILLVGLNTFFGVALPSLGALTGRYLGGSTGEFWADSLLSSLAPSFATLVFNTARIKISTKTKHHRHRHE